MSSAPNRTTDEAAHAAILTHGPNTLQEADLPPPLAESQQDSPKAVVDPNPLPAPVVYPAQGEHTHTFIFLHGRGDSGGNFAPWLLHARHAYGRRKSLPDLLPGVKFVFPSSRRYAAEGMGGGRTMPQWFDVASLADTWRREEGQLEGLRVSVADVHRLIREEMAVLPLQRIVLGGLSQGCATALYAMLTFEPEGLEADDKAPFAAMIGMSGWLPYYRSIRKHLPSNNTDDNGDDTNALHSTKERGRIAETSHIDILNGLRKLVDLAPLSSSDRSPLKTPVFIGHGAADPKVPPRNGEIAVASLRELGMGVEWHAYENFGHWIQEPDEVNDMIDFLRERAEVEVVGSKEE